MTHEKILQMIWIENEYRTGTYRYLESDTEPDTAS
jgi:hypothetical protein